MIPFGCRLFVAALAFTAMSCQALADRRVALIVGNSAYQNVPKLPNPVKDADAMAQLFKKAGFEVVSLHKDVSNLDYKRAIRRFEETARDADIAVVFYAGHAIEIGGVNYMIPVDAKLATDIDAPDEAITLDRLMETVDSSKKLGLVILDACRDNPFVNTMQRRRASRAVHAGLGKVEPTVAGTLIAYAAKAGSTAEDGAGDHSPFTTALLNHLTSPGLDVRLAFGRVRDQVMQLTSKRQEPFVYGSLGGATVAIVGTPQAITEASSSPAANDPAANARRDYEYFERVGTKDAWDAFLRLHSSGPYADLARMQRARVVAAGDASRQRATTEATPPPDKPATAVAAATPAARPEGAPSTPAAGLAPGEVTRMLQTELKRVGCYGGAVNGDWNVASRRALDGFNKGAGAKFEGKVASLAAVEAVREKQTRVCPLECARGSKAEGEQCVAVTCPAGQVAGASGACEAAKPAKAAAREPAAPKRDGAAAGRNASGPGSAAAGSGQGVACSRFGCQPVKRGCKVETTVFREETQQTVVCN
jgi:uncharacterized caspase-like protein